MRPKTIIAIVVASVIALGAIAGVIYGVATHTEATFDESSPPWPVELIPLGVTCSGDRCEVIEQAIRAANGRAGFELFVWGSREPVIFYFAGVPQAVGPDRTGNGQDVEGNLFHAGENTALWSRGGQAFRCEVRTSNTGDDSVLWVAAYHGAGHCVNLAHDPSDYTISVMRETQPDQLEPYDPAHLPSFTDSDRAALRARYHR